MMIIYDKKRYKNWRIRPKNDVGVILKLPSPIRQRWG